ncbi:hypothetical protein D5018_19420 [Parashewanella curva]|uniref:Uncharacterized protein n=1 Tax=Parashewanella curva TaxID=2338552 RepID=A0A3L8PT92_9GAMM|nr:hypothetical protein [Parashewanella curva]RLV58039.1 hypothetical protein D5018_19420 [Parashewanella curva]
MNKPIKQDSLFKHLKKIWNSLYQDNKYPFRLAGVVEKEGINVAIIKLTGSYITITEPVTKAVCDSKLIEGLNPLDIRSLSFFAMHEYMSEENEKLRESLNKLQHKYEFSGIEFDDPEVPIITLKDVNNGEVIEVSLAELFDNSELLNGLQKEDCCVLGYLKCLNEHSEGQHGKAGKQ